MFVLTTNHKGAIAEVEIAAAAVRCGVEVLRPVTEHGRYDLVFGIAARLFRVQCKWAPLAPDRSVVYVRTSGSYCTPNGHVYTCYREDEIDLLAAYCEALDRCFLLPSSFVAGKRQLCLRLTDPRNHQRACINLADDFDFPGAVAQLGERRRGTPEATGSSPVSSTPSISPAAFDVGAHEFRERFGYYIERAAAGDEVLVRRHGRPLVRVAASSG